MEASCRAMLSQCPPSPEEAFYVPPVYDDLMASSTGWQLLSVSLHRTPGLGFGIAISGGIDNPLYTSGEPAIVISDVVPNGPAWGLLQVNDRILSANGISFESIEYSRAVDVIKNSEHINMIVKRRVAMPVMELEQRTLKFTLTKSRRKDDFGIVLGCKFYIKEIRNPKLAEKDPGLREGDAVLRINGQSLDAITLDEAAKWLERSREKLCLVIQRDVRRGASRWPSTQTVYERLGSVAATPRHSPSPMLHQPLSARSSHEYINSPSWRLSSDKGMDVLDSSRLPNSSSPLIPSSPHTYHEYQYYSAQNPRTAERGVRNICFHKVGGSVGIRVVGGNEVGIFVSAVADDSPAARHGVCPGDRIVEVNGRTMRGVTREAAVQLLLSLDDRVVLKVEHASAQFEHIRQSQIGDNFFVRSHFTKDKKSMPLELTINEGDIFHVTDTLFGGTVGLWQAARVYSSTGKSDTIKGVIPNQMAAENWAREARRNMEQKGSKGTLLRRKLESRRTKSLPKNGMDNDLAMNVLPAYERVALSTPSFHRPLVLFGPLADVARRLLLSQFALRFAEPEGEGVIRLGSIDAVMAAGKHCVLDITMDSVERLQLAQYAPIVILIDVDGRSRIREIRRKLDAPHLSSRTLAEQASQIKKHHSHLLSATVDASHEEGWFDALRELIAHLQQRRLWMPEMPSPLPLEDVLLFTNKGGERDSDSERDRSLHADYGEYAQKGTNELTRSIYEWETSSRERSTVGTDRWSTLPRRPIGGPPQVPLLTTKTTIHPPVDYPNDDDDMGRSSNISLDRSIDLRRVQPPPSPKGCYHVQQLLDTTEESKLVHELANVRLEELRMRDKESVSNGPDKNMETHGNNYDFPPIEARRNTNGIHASSSGISSADHSTSGGGPSPGDKPTIAPKPSNFYGDARTRNKWNDAENGDESRSEAVTTKSEGNDEKRRSEEEEPTIVEQATAWLGSEGGLLSCPVANVQLIVPPGAIAEGDRHEVYIKVCEESSSDCAVDETKGEQLLSPLVMCGPHGLEFRVPVELRLPHSVKERAGEDWKFSLKTGDGEEWKHVDVNPDAKKPFISLPISKF